MNAPFYIARDEIISVKEAARRARCAPKAIAKACREHGIGRRKLNSPRGEWQVSAPALEMFLAGDFVALELLKAGNRTDPRVTFYFLKLNLVP
jgi:hypothetical protein